MSEIIQHRATHKHPEPGFAWAGSATDNQLEPVVGFEYPDDETDRGNPIMAQLTEASAKDKAEVAAELLRGFLFYIWHDGSGDHVSMQPAFRKFVVVSAVLRPELLKNKSYEQIGKKLGITKAGVSAIAKRFEKAFGCQFRRSHTFPNHHENNH